MEGHVLTHHHQERELDSKQVEMMKLLKEELGPGVDEALRKCGETGGLSDQTLKRWLAARKWDVGVAKRDLHSHVEWRQRMTPNGSIDLSKIQASIDEKKGFLQGFDRLGHPVALVRAQRHVPKGYDIMERFCCYCMDAVDRLGSRNPTWDGRLNVVLILTGMTVANYDLAGLRAVFDMLQNHYPERLYRMYLYDAPIIFLGLWKLVSPFVDPVTRQKVVFLSPQQLKGSLLEQEVPSAFLPPELGGTGPWRTTAEALCLMDAGSIDAFWADTAGGASRADADKKRSADVMAEEE